MTKKKQIDSKMAEIDTLEGKVVEHDELLRMGRELLSQYDAIEEHGSMVDMNDFFAHMSSTQQNALDLAGQEQYAKEQAQIKSEDDRVRRKARIYADELSKKIPSSESVSGDQDANKRSNDSPSITVQRLYDEFVNHKLVSKEWNKPRTQKGNVEMLNRILDALRYRKNSPNPSIHDFDVEDAIWFQDTFQRLPSNARKKYADAPMSEIMEMAEDSSIPVEQRISSTTYNTYARLLTAMFEYAMDKRQRYIEKNVFTDLQVKVKRKAKKRIPFSNENLHKFFSSTMFIEKSFETKFAWRYWIPIIMLYSGMRLEEIAQLTLSDIIKVEGIDCFNVKDSYGEDGILSSSAKTDSSERTVPIHSILIRNGFLSSYVAWLRKTGCHKLFPTLSNRKKDGEYKSAGDSVSKYFNEDAPSQGKVAYLTRQGIDKKKTGLVFYCLKHTVETLLNNHPDDIENEKIDTLIGHEIKSTGRKHYGGYNVNTIARVVEKIQYPDANLPWDTDQKYSSIPFPWER
jgi:integrase